MYTPFLILLILLKPNGGHIGDNNCWTMWSTHNFTEGITNIYSSIEYPRNNYLPLYNYILYFFGKFQGGAEAIRNNISSLKNITFLFELGSTLLLFKMLNDKIKHTPKAMFFSLFYFLNIGVLYNSFIWGQVDGIVAFFILFSLYFGINNKLFYSLLFLLLAINTKLQAAILFPVIILILFPLIIDRKNLKKILWSVLGIVIVQFFIVLPIIIGGELPALYVVLAGAVDKYAVVSMNAYNLWYILLSSDPITTPDSIEFMGLTYKTWGLLTFFTSSFFALFHFVKTLYIRIIKKVEIEFSTRKIWISGALIPLLFFFFNTQMHERYSQFALVFLAAYSFLYKKPLPFIFTSIAMFLNMEGVLHFFNWENYHTIIFMPWFIACIYLVVLVLLYLDLYNFRIKTGVVKNNVQQTADQIC
jgi:Gpi18-like mannosyltransferase